MFMLRFLKQKYNPVHMEEGQEIVFLYTLQCISINARIFYRAHQCGISILYSVGWRIHFRAKKRPFKDLCEAHCESTFYVSGSIL